MLDIKKVYIDTRYKTEDSASHSDFFIELPRTLNVPEKTICYLTDVVIPVSWSTVDVRNNKLYMYLDWKTSSGPVPMYRVITIPVKNYSGIDFAAALQVGINTAFGVAISFEVLYDLTDNMLTITQKDHFSALSRIVSGADLQVGNYWSNPIAKENISSMNGILRIGKTSVVLQETAPSYRSYIDLFTTRNLYITSSCLASYNIISNFGNDVIIKKIAVKAGYSQMLFDNADAGYDFLDVSKRSLSRLDFKLQDSYGNIIDLRNNHWSFSLVFQEQK
jgi:hypothetical protein